MSWPRRLLNFVRSERVSRDIDREIEFHIAERADALREQGMSDADARREARRRFGNRGIQAERTRDADIVGWLDSTRGDLRYALRALRRTPVFAVVAVASLALGIGANTAIYTLIDALVLRPLPVPNPEQLVQVSFGGEDGDSHFTNPLWEEIRDRRTGFTALAAFGDASLNRADGGVAQRVRGTWVSGEYFSVLNLPPAAGRLLTPADDVRGCPPLAVLGHGFWRSEYGGAANAIGRTIPLEGRPFTIVGVAPERFLGTEVGRESQIFLPLCALALLEGPRVLEARSSWWLRVVGRREANLTRDQVVARLEAIAPAAYEATVPGDWPAEYQAEYRTRTLGAVDASRGVSGLRTVYRGALVVLMGAVAIVLLIACANVANLLLARAAARERELAIRLAIGAARARLLRQLMTESVLLAVLGAAAGLLVAQWGTRALVALISTPSSQIVLDLSLDPRVLGFTALATLLTALLFGVAPAWRATRVSPQVAMSARGRGIAEGHARFTTGKALVAAQVALSLVLLVGAGLMIGSLRNLASIDPGFRPGGVLAARVDFTRAADRAAWPALHREMLDRVRAVPDVRSAAMAQITPLGTSSWNGKVQVEGMEPRPDGGPLFWFNEVSDGFFETMGVRLLAGRDFAPSDASGAEPVAIVNESVAKVLFGDASPLGRKLLRSFGPEVLDARTIIGVVADSKYRDLRESSSATIYLPSAQSDFPSATASLMVRGTGSLDPLIAAVTSAAVDLHPLTTVEFRTLSQQIESSLRRERMLAVLSSIFAGVALFLSMLGLYGVMAYAVARRRNEIGVRIALGADRRRVLGLVLGDVGRVVVLGLVVGLAGALSLGTLVRAFVYGLEPAEPSVIAAAVMLLGAVAFAAGFVPATRAASVDPMAALRED